MSDQKDFPPRFAKKLPTGYEETIQSMDTDEIKSKIYEAQCHVYEVEKAKDEDEKLNAAREMVKELSAPYKETRDNEIAKLKYCFFVLESRGVNLTPNS